MGGTTARTLVARPRPAGSLAELPAAYWSQMRRVCSPERPDVLIDHVLVGPSGIYLIRHLPAQPDGACLDATARADYAAVVAGLAPPRYRDRCRPVLCVRGGVERADHVDGVLVASVGALEHVVRFATPVLSSSEARQAYAVLRAALVDVPPEVDTSRHRLRTLVRMAAASAAVAAVSVGALVLGPEAMELLAGRG